MAKGARSKNHNSACQSAATDTQMRLEWANVDDQGAPVCAVGGVVLTTCTDTPYRVTLTAPDGACIDRDFATMRAAEQFIRWNSPAPAMGNTLFERPAESAFISKPLREVSR